MRGEQGDPTTWDVHHWQQRTPMILEGLLQTTLGSPIHIYHGGLLYAPVRYYDAANRRPGLPDGVGALVEKLAPDSVMLTLVNTSLLDAREIIIQAGTFGEHQFTRAAVLEESGDVKSDEAVESKWLSVHLAPGAGSTLRLSTKRYANRPTYETPWAPAKELRFTIKGRRSEP